MAYFAPKLHSDAASDASRGLQVVHTVLVWRCGRKDGSSRVECQTSTLGLVDQFAGIVSTAGAHSKLAIAWCLRGHANGAVV